MCFPVSFFHQKKSTGSFCPARSSSHPFSSLFSRALPNTRGTLRACKRRARPPNAITRHERPSRAREYRWQLVFFVALLLPRFTRKRVSRLVRDILRQSSTLLLARRRSQLLASPATPPCTSTSATGAGRRWWRATSTSRDADISSVRLRRQARPPPHALPSLVSDFLSLYFFLSAHNTNKLVHLSTLPAAILHCVSHDAYPLPPSLPARASSPKGAEDARTVVEAGECPQCEFVVYGEKDLKVSESGVGNEYRTFS